MKLFFTSFICFSITLYILSVQFFWEPIHYNHVDDIHIDDTITPPINKNEIKEKEITDITESTNPPLLSAQEERTEKKENKKIIFLYKPKKFKELAEKRYKSPIMESLQSDIFWSKIKDIVIILYENSNYVRGNMKNKVLRIYDPWRLGRQETFAVFLHELWHYIDLYHFPKLKNHDTSHEFYDISWETTKISKAWQNQENFVSWYAATNAYEDFSETFIYYILHNREFQEKTQSNTVLKRKYDFFANSLFIDDSFKDSSFSIWKQESYNRDITKLNFSLENFLDYLKKSI